VLLAKAVELSLSLQPHPKNRCVLHEVVDVALKELVEVIKLVVFSSKQPHHPGVLHVEVLVRVLVLVGFDEVVVV
jgi:hypothetical protein